MSNSSNHEPYTVYLLDESYYSGKVEAYLRYKEIAVLTRRVKGGQ